MHVHRLLARVRSKLAHETSDSVWKVGSELPEFQMATGAGWSGCYLAGS
jgi:hypothetical protein